MLFLNIAQLVPNLSFMAAITFDNFERGKPYLGPFRGLYPGDPNDTGAGPSELALVRLGWALGLADKHGQYASYVHEWDQKLWDDTQSDYAKMKADAARETKATC